MNTDIELVQDAVENIVLARKKRQAHELEESLLYQEERLKQLLKNITQATYHRTETDFHAYVDGVVFKSSGFAHEPFSAEHKILRKFFNWRWVKKKTTHFYFSKSQYDLQKILEQHLEALKWENQSKDSSDGC